MKWGIAKLPLGFVVAATYVPGGYMDSVRHDVPGLRRRGLYHLDYAGMTLRGNFGLPRRRSGRGSCCMCRRRRSDGRRANE